MFFGYFLVWGRGVKKNPQKTSKSFSAEFIKRSIQKIFSTEFIVKKFKNFLLLNSLKTISRFFSENSKKMKQNVFFANKIKGWAVVGFWCEKRKKKKKQMHHFGTHVVNNNHTTHMHPWLHYKHHKYLDKHLLWEDYNSKNKHLSIRGFHSR